MNLVDDFSNNEQVNQTVVEQLPAYQDSAELIKSVNSVSFELPLKNADPELINKFRVACSKWKVDLQPATKITSHRPVVGKFIVAFKKIFYSMLRTLLKDYIREQKEFNAASLAVMAEISQKK